MKSWNRIKKIRLYTKIQVPTETEKSQNHFKIRKKSIPLYQTLKNPGNHKTEISHPVLTPRIKAIFKNIFRKKLQTFTVL